MSALTPPTFTGRHIVVADEDRRMVDMIIHTLRDDGHAVFHAYDVLSATQLATALEVCDLVISNTKVEGSDGVELTLYLRKHRPTLPIIYLANMGRSTPEAEAQLPADVPILREPFTAENLRANVAAMLEGKPMVAIPRRTRRP
jgi:DNA-binding response OmpR family regulator